MIIQKIDRCLVDLQTEGALVVTPDNTAVLSEQSAVLRCSTDNSVFGGDSITWNRQVAGSASNELLANGCRLPSSSSSLYSVDTSSAGHCDLVVNNTSASLAGVYTCSEPNVQTAQAFLTIIGKPLSSLALSAKAIILSSS